MRLLFHVLFWMLPLLDGLAAGWNVGVARVKITPAESIWMSGYASRDKPAGGTLEWGEGEAAFAVNRRNNPEQEVRRLLGR